MRKITIIAMALFGLLGCSKTMEEEESIPPVSSKMLDLPCVLITPSPFTETTEAYEFLCDSYTGAPCFTDKLKIYLKQELTDQGYYYVDDYENADGFTLYEVSLQWGAYSEEYGESVYTVTGPNGIDTSPYYLTASEANLIYQHYACLFLDKLAQLPALSEKYNYYIDFADGWIDFAMCCGPSQYAVMYYQIKVWRGRHFNPIPPPGGPISL